MNIEKDFIKLISGNFSKSKEQFNKLFECDSEVLQFGEKKLFLNVDEFSSEDMFRENDPYILGWNAAVGGISDILASGGIPVFYAHNLVISSRWNKEYVKCFSKGVSDVLDKGNISFVGGDFGIANEYRYTAVVIGSGETYILRSGAMAGDSIYISGKIGTGNLEAVMKLYTEDKRLGSIINRIKNKFNTKFKEANLIRKYSKCCTDTSDGLLNALNNIAEMSGKGYKIKNIPYLKSAVFASKLISLPKTLLMMGECGEYELLFTLKKDIEEEFLIKAQENKLKFYKIGEITKKSEKLLIEENKHYNLEKINIRGRDYQSKKEYIKDMVESLKKSIIKD